MRGRRSKPSPLCLATSLVIGPNRQPIRFAFRENPENRDDSGWRFYSGYEDEEFESDSSNYKICPLDGILDMQPDLKAVIDSPAGTAWEMSPGDIEWKKVDDYEIN